MGLRYHIPHFFFYLISVNLVQPQPKSIDYSQNGFDHIGNNDNLREFLREYHSGNNHLSNPYEALPASNPNPPIRPPMIHPPYSINKARESNDEHYQGPYDTDSDLCGDFNICNGNF